MKKTSKRVREINIFFLQKNLMINLDLKSIIICSILDRKENIMYINNYQIFDRLFSYRKN